MSELNAVVCETGTCPDADSTSEVVKRVKQVAQKIEQPVDERLRPVYKTHVQVDEFTEAASTAFDYTFTGEASFTGFNVPNVPEEYRIGLIVGPSGSGKSLLLSNFGKEEEIGWEPSKGIVSHFANPQDALNRLSAVGLSDIPSWVRPHHVLSNGQQFRANLARRIKDGAVIDEFTSVVDRNVARSVSNALRRYVDKNDVNGMVLASCHYDIIEWLRPDWFFDTTDGTLYDGRSLRRPQVTLRLYPALKDTWQIFAKHHYLTADFNKAARAYIGTADFGEGEMLVAFTAIMPLPSGTVKNAWRGHRTVVLPDFQGLGIGPAFSDMTAQLITDEGKVYYSRTAHPRFGDYRDRSPIWTATAANRKKTSPGKNLGIGGDGRVGFSHKYSGPLDLKYNVLGPDPLQLTDPIIVEIPKKKPTKKAAPKKKALAEVIVIDTKQVQSFEDREAQQAVAKSMTAMLELFGVPEEPAA